MYEIDYREEMKVREEILNEAQEAVNSNLFVPLCHSHLLC